MIRTSQAENACGAFKASTTAPPPVPKTPARENTRSRSDADCAGSSPAQIPSAPAHPTRYCRCRPGASIDGGSSSKAAGRLIPLPELRRLRLQRMIEVLALFLVAAAAQEGGVGDCRVLALARIVDR